MGQHFESSFLFRERLRKMNGIIETFCTSEVLIRLHREEAVSSIMSKDKGLGTQKYKC